MAEGGDNNNFFVCMFSGIENETTECQKRQQCLQMFVYSPKAQPRLIYCGFQYINSEQEWN